MISGGKPFRGGNGEGVELGHVVIVHDGRPCQGGCKGHGHLEVRDGARARPRREGGLRAEPTRVSCCGSRVRETSGPARSSPTSAASRLRPRLVANIFAPELIVIGGGFGVASWEYLIPPAEEVLRREALRPMREEVRVVRASSARRPG